MAEIKVQRKAGGRPKWPWVLILIPVIWFALRAGGIVGKDDASASDSANATDSSAAKRADTTKKPPL